MRGSFRVNLVTTVACLAIISLPAFAGLRPLRAPVSDALAQACPAGMVYDGSMELCVPRGMSYDTNFVSPPACGADGPATCRGPVPRSPAPGGTPVETPGGHYRPGNH